jgi:hypothetical protein
MTQLRSVLRLISLALLPLLACEENDTTTGTPPIDQSTTIFPLTVGNKWIIDVTNYDSVGAMVYSRRDSIRILRDTTIQQETWYIGYGILTNRTDGLYDYQAGTTSAISQRFRYPAAAGTSYPYRGVTVKILSIAETITVPAGTFVCYRYRTGIDSVAYSDEYLARGVGLVKSESFNPLSSGGVYRYLTYNLVAHTSN